MLSDSSLSSSPVKKRPDPLYTSSSDDDEPITRRRRERPHRLRLTSSSSSGSDVISRPSRLKKHLIPSSSLESLNDESMPGTSRIMVRHTSVCSVSSSSSDSDSIIDLPRARNGRKRNVSDSESSSSNEESTKKPNKQLKMENDSSDSDDGEKCVICFKSLQSPFARPSNCVHRFHFTCLDEWTKTSNTCPIDRVKYTSIVTFDDTGKVTSRRNVKTPPPQDHYADVLPEDTTYCEICSENDREHEMLLCDRCECGFHMDCLDPPLGEIPSGEWFCPNCTELGHEDVVEVTLDEVNGLLEDADDLLQHGGGFRRQRRNIPSRNTPVRRTHERIMALVYERMNQPSTSSTSLRVRRRPRRSRTSRRTRQTRYDVELVTIDGNNVEVKVAVNTRRRKKTVKKRSKKRSRRSNEANTSSACPAERGHAVSIVPPLDLFGTRPQLDYFSGCEAEDEQDEAGGLSVIRAAPARTSVRSMMNRKQIAASILNRPRRIPRIATSTAPPDLVSSILEEQEKWLSPNSVITCTRTGDVNIVLNDQKEVPVKKAPGGPAGGENQRGGHVASAPPISNQRSSQSNTSGESRRPSTYQPLQPPPEPPRLYEDEDFDLYADIEPPNNKLAPPPEPPAILLAMEDDKEDGGSSPEDTMLVIDDRQQYDPEMPTSPPSPAAEKPKEEVKPAYPEHQSSEEEEEEVHECPNQGIYSKISVSIAKESNNDSDDSGETPLFLKVKVPEETKSSSEIDEAAPPSSEDKNEELSDPVPSEDMISIRTEKIFGASLNGSEESLNKLEDNGKNTSKDEGEGEGDVLELDDRDGLVDITDEEISTYERNWELEDGQPDKSEGLDGLEAISDCESPAEEHAPKAKVNSGSKEEGEIVVEEKAAVAPAAPVQWKKLSKGTKERSYREKDSTKEKSKRKDSKKKEKRKELERYDVRKLITERPRRKVDEFGRDISSKSRSKSKTATRSRTRTRSPSRGRRRKSRGRSRSRAREKSKDKKKRSRSRRSRSPSKKRARSRTPRKKLPKSKERKKKRKSTSCSSCSCSSCEREKRRKDKKITVVVPNKGESKDEKRRSKYKEKKASPKRRRVDSPVPSKEVFTSGDNILVSVNFKSSKTGDRDRSKERRKKREEDGKKKKDKNAKENQPLRSIVTAKGPTASSKERRKLNTKNLKPVAIIDLESSPFREQTLSPKEVIILTDSDSDEKTKETEKSVPVPVTGPKTPPEPHVKFNIINKQQQLRTLSNPLMDSVQAEGDGEEDIMHKGPNTPPEPPVPYDPFEPTKSRSPTPVQGSPDRNPSPPPDLQRLTPPQTVPLLTPPKLPQHDSPKTPSPLHSPPKPVEEVEAPVPAPAPSSSVPLPCVSTVIMDSGDDSPGDCAMADSPYSPGSSEADDLFEPPMPQISTPTPVAKVKPRSINKHTPLKLTPTPLKKRPGQKTPTKPKNSLPKKEIGIKLDEDQLKILDDLPNSAVELQVKDKFLKKLNRQERVVEEVKIILKPHYAKKHVTKEEYKDILRKAVPKICHSRSGEINPQKIQKLVEAYVKKYRHKKKKKAPAPLSVPSLQLLRPKAKTSMWC